MVDPIAGNNAANAADDDDDLSAASGSLPVTQVAIGVGVAALVSVCVAIALGVRMKRSARRRRAAPPAACGAPSAYDVAAMSSAYDVAAMSVASGYSIGPQYSVGSFYEWTVRRNMWWFWLQTEIINPDVYFVLQPIADIYNYRKNLA